MAPQHPQHGRWAQWEGTAHCRVAATGWQDADRELLADVQILRDARVVTLSGEH